MKINSSIVFLYLGSIALIFGALMGLVISIVYIDPDFLKDFIPFNQLRPLHTTSVISWIILTATGGIYYYINHEEKLDWHSKSLKKAHLIIFILAGIGIYSSLLLGKMGGREYLEFYPLLTIPIVIGWILFGFNYFKTVYVQVKNWPVYYWMWAVGIVFMIYHLAEAHFWMFSEIRTDYIKDLSIQWKSYGSFVGSWNMLIYGTAIYLMSKINSDPNSASGKKVFFFFFLGLTNLMFGWAHHTYIIPSQPWIRYVAYAISMTEWILFFHIIFSWSKSLNKEKRKNHLMAVRFLLASEVWVFINLVLALLMSIPSINFYTHGTPITLAHSMGTTIGINTTILLASVSFIVGKLNPKRNLSKNKSMRFGFIIFNTSLLLFWLTLVVGGIAKAYWMEESAGMGIGLFHKDMSVVYGCFVFFGSTLLAGIIMMVLPLLKTLERSLFKIKN